MGKKENSSIFCFRVVCFSFVKQTSYVFILSSCVCSYKLFLFVYHSSSWLWIWLIMCVCVCLCACVYLCVCLNYKQLWNFNTFNVTISKLENFQFLFSIENLPITQRVLATFPDLAVTIYRGLVVFRRVFFFVCLFFYFSLFFFSSSDSSKADEFSIKPVFKLW